MNDHDDTDDLDADFQCRVPVAFIGCLHGRTGGGGRPMPVHKIGIRASLICHAPGDLYAACPYRVGAAPPVPEQRSVFTVPVTVVPELAPTPKAPVVVSPASVPEPPRRKPLVFADSVPVPHFPPGCSPLQDPPSGARIRPATPTSPFVSNTPDAQSLMKKLDAGNKGSEPNR